MNSVLQQTEYPGRIRVKNNPYCQKIFEYPGRLFPLSHFEQEKEQLAKVRDQFERVVLEIGSGSGGHLIEYANKHPETCVIGIEKRFKRAFRTIEKACKLKVSNVFVIRADVSDALELFDYPILNGAFIYFPDPWERPRGAKHRLLTLRFVKQLLPLMTAEAFLKVKTDHYERFSEFIKSIEHYNKLEKQCQVYDLYRSEYLEDNISTEFERLFCSKGTKICFATYKVSDDIIRI